MARKVRVCIGGFDERFLRSLDEFYRLLDGVGGRYRFECRGGRCTSYVEVEAPYVSLFSSFPGLRVLGSCSEGSILIPPPRGSEVGGGGSQLRGGRSGFVLGFSGGEPVRVELDDLYRHVLIVGSTGAGKSHTAARIARCASELGVDVVVLDWHGEYSRLLEGRGKLLAGESLPAVNIIVERLTLEESIAALEYALELSIYQSTLLTAILSAVLKELRAGEATSTSAVIGDTNVEEIRKIIEADNTIRGLANAVEQAYQSALKARQSKGENEVWLALIRRLNTIAFSEYAKLFRVKGSSDTANSMKGLTILDLSSIRSVRIRKLYTLLLLYKLYASRIKNSSPIVIVADEAHHIIASQTVREIVGEARKYMVGLVAVTHTPQTIPLDVLANFNTIISHKITSNEDRGIVAQLLGDVRLAEVLSKLAPGEALMKAPSMESHAIISVNLNTPCS